MAGEEGEKTADGVGCRGNGRKNSLLFAQVAAVGEWCVQVQGLVLWDGVGSGCGMGWGG